MCYEVILWFLCCVVYIQYMDTTFVKVAGNIHIFIMLNLIVFVLTKLLFERENSHKLSIGICLIFYAWYFLFWKFQVKRMNVDIFFSPIAKFTYHFIRNSTRSNIQRWLNHFWNVPRKIKHTLYKKHVSIYCKYKNLFEDISINKNYLLIHTLAIKKVNTNTLK